jgi:hypothetical protein
VVTVHRTATADASASHAVNELREEIAAAGPGRAHLLRKRLADLERDALRQLERDAVEQVLHALREVAENVYTEPLPHELAERPLLRASVLVRRDDEPHFVRVAEALGSGWYEVQLTGPWPAYRFSGLEHAAAAS